MILAHRFREYIFYNYTPSHDVSCVMTSQWCRFQDDRVQIRFGANRHICNVIPISICLTSKSNLKKCWSSLFLAKLLLAHNKQFIDYVLCIWNFLELSNMCLVNTCALNEFSCHDICLLKHIMSNVKNQLYLTIGVWYLWLRNKRTIISIINLHFGVSLS